MCGNYHIEVDGEYVWALEVLVCHHLDNRYDQDPDAVESAWRIVDENNLVRPMDRFPD